MNAPAPTRPLRIFLVACEESGDRLGAGLMRALAASAGRPVEFAGIGGRHMAEQGLESLFAIDQLAIVGFNAVFARLPDVAAPNPCETALAVVTQRPDVLVIIDSPDFTHRVARRACRSAKYSDRRLRVSPTVWAWRPGRARARCAVTLITCWRCSRSSRTRIRSWAARPAPTWATPDRDCHRSAAQRRRARPPQRVAAGPAGAARKPIELKSPVILICSAPR